MLHTPPLVVGVLGIHVYFFFGVVLVFQSGRTVKQFVTFDMLVVCNRNSVRSGSVQSGFFFVDEFDTMKRSFFFSLALDITYILHTHTPPLVVGVLYVFSTLLRLSLEFYIS